MIRTTFISFIMHLFFLALLLVISWARPKALILKPATSNLRWNLPGAARPPAPPTRTPSIVAARPSPPPPQVTPAPTPPPTPKIPAPTPAPPKTKTPAPIPPPTPTPDPNRAKRVADAKSASTPAPKATATPAPQPTLPPNLKQVTSVPAAPTPAPQRTVPPNLQPLNTPPSSTRTPAPGAAQKAPAGAGPPGTSGVGLPDSSPGNIEIQSLDLPDYYLAVAQARIRENFLIYKGRNLQGVTAEVEFTILKDGSITSIRVIKSTGDKTLDELAVNALESTQQLGSLPESLKLDFMRVRVTFNYEM